ncbi:hypothetical protein EDF56_1011036 [Novosphingobium sp. PhB165]|uniref:hypothetical protein n=1 Tax=Novosphingobium sp. PhB165 TaxID=2485105 RepID=UPI0010DA89FC|nr:hypothetical protein [Novosphingobium sp. PhB165]TCM22346.1 hypothetical protein EDF56_1011036 [Novosphingobium sp. PhB165]
MNSRIRAWHVLVGTALALTSVWAVAQDAPESLLPKGFEEPTPTPTPAAAPAAAGNTAAPRAISTPMVQPIPGTAPAAVDAGAAIPALLGQGGLTRVPTLEELERMSPEDFEDLLGNKIDLDMPPQARRSMEQIGLMDDSEGGLPAASLGSQNASVVEAALAANQGQLVSRWGHILLRRALISRLAPPAGMSPQRFLALRVALLLRMGESDAARAVLQDIDIANYTPELGDQAFETYQRAADFTGLCPVFSSVGSLRDDAQWDAAKAICEAFRGSGASAMAKLDKMRVHGSMERIDLLLAQKYAGAAGRSRKAVTIEWDGVTTMTPWRFGLANAVGLTPPDSAMADADPLYNAMTALAPMVGLERRAAAADHAGSSGVLSNAAMVDLYGQLYSDPEVTGDWQQRAETLRNAYVLEDPSARFSAMQSLWNGANGADAVYARQVLTAAAAARIAPTKDMEDQAPALLTSMLAAGFDSNALAWSPVVASGSQGWALLVLAAPGRIRTVGASPVNTYIDADNSTDKRRSAFLVAGLAALGRIDSSDAGSLSGQLGLGLDSSTRYTAALDRAAANGDSAGVVLLAGLGMQGDDWHRMTPRYLFHIVSALRTVGLEADARMIAAEAVARA